MSEKTTSIFQSGERVHIAGTYEVIGIGATASPRRKEASTRDFRAGERFCCYDGIEVIWRLVKTEVPDTARSSDAARLSQ
ncbi:MAG TPA: hypothetical protein VKQ72_09610 [Aggregatilineales bacterium]|nr:hypothetical protein [Aggregatilineales bacterium]